MVCEMLLSGATRSDIMRYNTGSKDKQGETWGLQIRQIDAYIKSATVKIQAQYDSEREGLTNDTYAKYKSLYRKLINTKDYRGAALMLDKISLLTGINAAQQVDIKTGGEKITAWIMEPVKKKK